MDNANQPPTRTGFNAWDDDAVLRYAVKRHGAEWVGPRASELGALVGSEQMQLLARDANRHAPELRTHDRQGERLDRVDFHPAYHELMRLAFGAGLHSLAWTAAGGPAHVARAALGYLWNQAENGTACPVTMSFAACPLLDAEPALAADWRDRLLAESYDPRPVHVSKKTGVTIGMAMTERAGGSDLAGSIAATARRDGDAYLLEGEKWFCSVPMSDAFFTLARTRRGVSCFFVPRWHEDGTANAIRLQRLKDKCGNRSNATAEVEFKGTRATLVGEEGRGIATLIRMAHLTRFDIVVACAGMMRAAAAEAVHHVTHRQAFGKRLADQPLMRNVIADIALEWEAATLTAFRLAEAFDRAGDDPREHALARILTPIAKYWLCKRVPVVVAEAMECLGGGGFTEDGPLARLYREAPLNGIWEGSGNVICLDVLRAISREPDSVDALAHEIAAGDPGLSHSADELRNSITNGASDPSDARRTVEKLAVAVQSSLMARYASDDATEAFVATRVAGEGGRQLGTLPSRFIPPDLPSNLGPAA